MSTFNYTSRDFGTIKADLTSRAAAMIPDWTDRSPADFMVALVDLWAYSADVLHYYVDRAATEAFLSTATQRDSVLAFANLYDYTPNFRQSATVSIQVSNPTNTNIAIPSGTRFYAGVGSSRVEFYASTTVTAASNSSVNVVCTQGVQKTKQSVTSLNTNAQSKSDGTSSQRFTIPDQYVAPTSVSVYVTEGSTESLWTYDDQFTNSSAASNTYSLYVTTDGYVQIVFGNGVNGRIPATNSTISASYATNSGSTGNVPANTITNFVNPITGLVVVGNASAAVGGSDAESIDSLKRSIPAALRTQSRAVSLTDYEDLALGVQGVSKTKAVYAGTGVNGGSVTVYAVAYQSDFLTGASVISVGSSLRNDVSTSLQAASMLGITNITVPSTITCDLVKITMDVVVRSNYVQEWVRLDVAAAIDALFTFDQTSFGKRLPLGDVYRTAMTVAGVDYVSITAFNTDGNASVQTAVTASSVRLLKKGTVVVTATGGVTPSGS